MNSSVHRFRVLACGIALLACIDSGCTPTPVRAEPQPYEAPRVDCEQQDTRDTPPWPVLWFLDGPVFAIEVLGILAEERDLRDKEHDCTDKLKAKGIIR